MGKDMPAQGEGAGGEGAGSDFATALAGSGVGLHEAILYSTIVHVYMCRNQKQGV